MPHAITHQTYTTALVCTERQTFMQSNQVQSIWFVLVSFVLIYLNTPNHPEKEDNIRYFIHQLSILQDAMEQIEQNTSLKLSKLPISNLSFYRSSQESTDHHEYSLFSLKDHVTSDQTSWVGQWQTSLVQTQNCHEVNLTTLKYTHPPFPQWEHRHYSRKASWQPHWLENNGP